MFANHSQPFKMKAFVTESENNLIARTLRNETFGSYVLSVHLSHYLRLLQIQQDLHEP